MPDILRRYPHLLMAGIAALLSILAYGVITASAVPTVLDLTATSLHYRIRGPLPATDQVAIVAIDDRTVEEYGNVSLSRPLLARLVAAIGAQGARAIALPAGLEAPDQVSSTELGRPVEAARAAIEANQPAAARQALDDLALILSPERALAQTMTEHGPVVLPIRLQEGSPPDAEAQDRLARSAIGSLDTPEGSWRAIMPPSVVTDAAWSLAVGGPVFDNNSSTLTWPVGRLVLPSMALEMARLAQGLDRSQVARNDGGSVRFGDKVLAADRAGRFPFLWLGPEGTIPTISARDLLAGAVPADRLRDRVVLIGPTAQNATETLATPFTARLPRVERSATIVDDILSDRWLRQPGWVVVLTLLAILGVAFGPALLVGRWGTPGAAAGVVLLLGLWLALCQSLFNGGIVMPTMAPLLAALLVMIALTVDQVVRRERARARADEALRLSEERYALAAQGANDGLWDWDLSRELVYYSPRWRGQVGEPDAAPVTGAPADWLDRIHPDDRGAVEGALQEHLAGTIPQFEQQYRILHTDGRERWMLARGIAVRDAAGKPMRIAGSQTDITERRRLQDQLLHAALHDHLTGLANRALFLDRVTQALETLGRDPLRRFAVVHFNLDRFKTVNDSLGFFAGNRLLVAAAQRLAELLRPGDTLARLAGDEFAVLAQDFAREKDVLSYAEGLLRALAQPHVLDDRTIFVSASVGVATCTSAGERAEEVLRAADLAQYRAKQGGGGRVVLYEPAMQSRAVQRFGLEAALRHAVADQTQLQVYYQPVVSLADRRIVGFEALMRWRHPELGMVSPGDFIPLAEDTGMIVEMGRWALLQACRQTATWRARFSMPLEISVNVSGRQFAQADFAGDVRQALERSGLKASALKLEVTESMVMADPERTAELLRRVVDLGVRISIDDFGTGYSSLAYLHTFPFNTLKIDRSFVIRMSTSAESAEIVRIIAWLAHALRRDMIAEGVETDDQASTLHQLGVQYGQGYLFAKPMSAEEASEFLSAEVNARQAATGAAG
ncbi:EAL domain-containing protein [Zavarzinia sp. CC-PAN008]|uniref:EAL domain-containing protein n=1 Tax=Zavarzinia sp. CC-PAN008 TaxID=3243332 RepID=UPI003F74958B